MISIIIPTTKRREEIESLVQEIKEKTKIEYEIVFTCTAGSAAENRNSGLDMAVGDPVIMVDDDVFDLPHGWADSLIKLLGKNVGAVSARLMGKMDRFSNIDYTKPGLMTPQNNDMTKDFIEVDYYMPTTCVAFHKTDLRFNPDFKGSGYEDTYFFWQMKKRQSRCKFIINNKCQVKHRNEKKNQIEHWSENGVLFSRLTHGAKWHG